MKEGYNNMKRSNSSLLKEELLSTLGFMHLVDNQTDWKEIKEEIQIGVTSHYEVTEEVLLKLKNWIQNEDNEDKLEIDMLEQFYHDLKFAWDEVIKES